ncbi:hypothetical protein BDB01DRAFT_811627 [Pilobolus umbonatus]|nr:hypothetical protein BDB01DRAFT_811627 [Pilobolus umbonatus]
MASPTSNSCIVSTKRKRPNLHVSFCTLPQIVIYTHSQSDYDRSGLFPETPINNNVYNNDNKSLIFTLSINFVNTPIINTQKIKLKSNKRPKLSIDTSNLQGPLYFTNMTTNHQRKKMEMDEDVLDNETRENTRRNSLPLIC